MADHSSIDWTDSTWNPVTGCSKVSPGCNHCYAETLSLRFGWSKHPWNDQWATENVVLHPERLDMPLRWTRPRRVFVNSMSDLFHPLVDEKYVAKVFAIMGLARQHAYQVLTKRPERMANLLADEDFQFHVGWFSSQACRELNYPRPDNLPDWPYRHVWIGTSVEDQRRAEERIPHLLRTPAAVRFLSCEPLLGPVDIAAAWPGLGPMNTFGFTDGFGYEAMLHWVIAGGESGPRARPCNEDWLRGLRDQCRAADVAFFLKQLGGHPNKRSHDQAVLDGQTWREYPREEVGDGGR